MWIYWFAISLPVLGIFAPWRLNPRSQRIMWALVLVGFTCFVGLRDMTGGDWNSYQESYYRFGAWPFRWLLEKPRDPAYYWPAWLLYRMGLPIQFMNFFCASVLIAGVVRFCRSLRFPWVGFLAAVPYLIIVVGMGYTRQATAIGLVLCALVELGRDNKYRYVFFILAAAAFHRTAVGLLPIMALVTARNRMWTIFWAGILVVLAGWLFLFDSVQAMYTSYVVSQYSEAADGAPLRIGMGAIPSVFFLLLRNRFGLDRNTRRLWTVMCVLALAFVPLLLVSYTAVDRFALYFLPVQIFVSSALMSLPRSAQARTGMALAIVGYYLLVFFVWSHFAGNAFRWFPYHWVGWPG
jgi:hypothetical protein